MSRPAGLARRENRTGALLPSKAPQRRAGHLVSALRALRRHLISTETSAYAVVILIAVLIASGVRAQTVGESAIPAGAEEAYVAPDGRTFDQLVAAHVLPDPGRTPGVINPAVTDATLSATVCSTAKDRRGFDWVHDQRPPDSYTDPLKLKDLPPGDGLDWCEYDHLDSIEDGGSPTDPRNLWCMVYADRYGARVKDRLETRLHRLLCAGKISLADARAALADQPRRRQGRAGSELAGRLRQVRGTAADEVRRRDADAPRA